MFAKTYDIIRTFIFHIFLARRSKLIGVTKWQVFSLLSSLYLKALVHPGREKIITHRVFNYTVSAYSYGDLLYLFKEIFLHNDYYFNAENPEPRIIDCGANIGMAILYFKMLYPTCSIMAFEPNPFAFEVLKKNIAQNNLKDVRIENTALSDKSGTIDFFLGQNKGSLAGSIIAQRAGDNVINVQVSKLSDFMKDQTFDFIKIDIEGAEQQVLNNLVETGNILKAGKYTVEYHHRMRPLTSNLSGFLQPFESLGFGYSISGTPDSMSDESQNILIKLYRQNRPES